MSRHSDPGLPRPWRTAWQDALYGERGFYRRPEGPAGHFTTSTHGALGTVFAEVVAALADVEGCRDIVDVGAGRGELLTHLAAARPDLTLRGVDVVSRPHELPDAVDWLVSPGGPRLPDDLDRLTETLVIAHEWLDVVPCTIAEVDETGTVREVMVDNQGVESLGERISLEDQAWADSWWPNREVGDRLEIGLTRDAVWADLVRRVDSGTVVAVDYAQPNPPHATFTAYRSGNLVPAIPDGSCDLTAHVLVESLTHDEALPQAALMRRLGFTAATPPHDLSRTDPLAYVRHLSRAGTIGTLSDPGGLGGFRWVLRRCRPGDTGTPTDGTAYSGS